MSDLKKKVQFHCHFHMNTVPLSIFWIISNEREKSTIQETWLGVQRTHYFQISSWRNPAPRKSHMIIFTQCPGKQERETCWKYQIRLVSLTSLRLRGYKVSEYRKRYQHWLRSCLKWMTAGKITIEPIPSCGILVDNPSITSLIPCSSPWEQFTFWFITLVGVLMK